MLFQVLCGFEPIFYTTHPNEESYFITDKGVSQLYEMLKDMNFARISRSIIINFENVNTIGDEIIMTDGVKLKSSRRMKKQIQEDFFNYMCKVARVERADR